MDGSVTMIPSSLPSLSQPILLWVSNPDQRLVASRWADSMGVSVVWEQPIDHPLYLALTEERLELRHGDHATEGPIHVDFVAGKMGYRYARGLGRKEPLGRAVGLKKGSFPSLLDATPGLGRDGFILACLGCSVRWVERHPIVHALLQDGLNRARKVPHLNTVITHRLSLLSGDARVYMTQTIESGSEPEEVVYLDPMYPHRTKSAWVKKEMRGLRRIVGDDEDAHALLTTALNYAQNRVVVKRPHPSTPLADRVPDYAITTKKTRYDIYLTHPNPTRSP